MRFPWTKVGLPEKPKVEPLEFTLHTESILRALASDPDLAEQLLRYSHIPELEFIATPITHKVNVRVPRFIKDLPWINYRKPEGLHGIIAEVEVPKRQLKRGVLVGRQITPGLVTALFKCSNSGAVHRRLTRALQDIFVHESLSRNFFVTTDPDVLSKKGILETRYEVAILPLDKALECADLYLKQHGRYYVKPPSYHADRLLYYVVEARQLLPAFRRAWSVAVFSRDGRIFSEHIFEYLESLMGRFLRMLYARDRIGYEFFRRADNNTQDEMLYHLDYLVVLATGLFDTLAWLTKHRYGMQLKREQVELKIDPGKEGSTFTKRLANKDRPLHAFILEPANRNLVHLFYPLRDSIQHRHISFGVGYINMAEGWRCNFVKLTADAANAIQKVDIAHANDFTSYWGVFENLCPDGHGLEPYKFARAALAEISRFTNKYLQMLQLDELIASYPDIRQRVESSAHDNILTAGMPPGIMWLWKALDERLIEDLRQENLS